MVGLGFLVGWLGFSHVNSTIYLEQFCISLFFHNHCTRGKPRTPNTHDSGWWRFQSISCAHFFLPSPDYQPLQALGFCFRWQTGLQSNRKKKRQTNGPFIEEFFSSSLFTLTSKQEPEGTCNTPCTPIQGYWHVLNWEDLTYVNLPKGKSAPSIFLPKNK